MVRSDILRIATRKSPLALWQAQHVRERLASNHPGLDIELVTITTQGDKILDTPLAELGGKGLFVKELEQALLSGSADIAVHSMKDVPAMLPDGLEIAVILEREDPLDAFVSNHFDSFHTLPSRAKIGTSSLRRQLQIKSRYPDCELLNLRGNVGTRLNQLDEGRYDAIVLACAGLKRLGLETRITQSLRPEESLPAVGQGAIGIECRRADDCVQNYLSALHDDLTAQCVRAERALNGRLAGGCQVPIAAYAMIEDASIWLRALVGMPDGSRLFRAELRGSPLEAETIGLQVAEMLLEAGAGEVLEKVYGSTRGD